MSFFILESSKINLDNVWISLLFVLSVFVVPIVLSNLLNALAISDTQRILDDVEIADLTMKIDQLRNNEMWIPKDFKRIKEIMDIDVFSGEKTSCLINFIEKTISLVPKDKSEEGKSDINNVSSEEGNSPNVSDGESTTGTNNASSENKTPSCSKNLNKKLIDRNTIEKFRQIIEEEEQKKETNQLGHRFKNVEKLLQNIEERIEVVAKKIK